MLPNFPQFSRIIHRTQESAVFVAEVLFSRIEIGNQPKREA